MSAPETLAAKLSGAYRHNATFGYDLPNALVAVWLACGSDFQLQFDIADDTGVDRLMHWWLAGGMSFPGAREILNRPLAERLHLAPLAAKTGNGARPLTPLLNLILRNRPDVTKARGGHPASVWQWWLEHGPNEYFRADPWFFAQQRAVLAPDEAELQGAPGAPPGTQSGPDSGAPPRPAADETTLPRVTLFGHPKGEFGLGEDVRLLRRALNRVGIEPAVLRAPWPIGARQSIEEPCVDATAAALAGDTVIFACPAFDTVTLMTKLGPAGFAARRRIGFWQWELTRFPRVAEQAFDLVDEVWCHSEHAAVSFQGSTDKPVIKVPLPVDVPQVEPAARSGYGLADDAFVVFTSFDGASSISRKNPLGAIHAFEAAFPRNGTVKAQLIVKAMTMGNDSLWRECRRRAALDERIVILEAVLDRAEYYRLLRACDAVISLHRAEGFGRLMAEAMALEIPVIATGYSGNLDFMTAENSWLVPGALVPVFAGDYPFYEGQVWCEPDVGAAAAALRDCAGDPEARRRRARAGRLTIETQYGLEVCGAVYHDLLGIRPER